MPGTKMLCTFSTVSGVIPWNKSNKLVTNKLNY